MGVWGAVGRVLLAAGLVNVAAAAVAARAGAGGLTAANFAEFRGGVLAKNGEQTSCEIGLIDYSAAFVAANCFDYTGNGAVDASTKYSAWIIPTAEGTSVMRAAIDPKDIHVHPAYDPKTLANNIAVVQFNKGVVAPYVSYINTDLDLPDTQLGYVRRTFNDKKKVWNPLQLALQSGDSSGCAESSALYGANEGWLACTSAATSSVYRDSCSVPFGTLYYATSGQIVLSAIFSHAVVQAKSTCGDGSAPAWHSYYTQLWPHIGLAVSVLGRSLDVYSNLTPMNATLKDIRSMSIPSNTAPPRGAIVAGGNFYPLQGADQGEDKDQDQDTHSSEADEPTSSDEKKSSSHHDKSSRHDRSSRQDDKTSDQDDKSLDQDDASDQDSSDSPDAADSGSSSSSGLTKTHKIIVGVLVPVGAIIIAIGLFVLYRIWAAKRQDHVWDPRNNMGQLQDAANEIAQHPGHQSMTPPAYADTVFTPPLSSTQYTQLPGDLPVEKPPVVLKN